MPKVVETLLQVKQRQTRELKARTQARCAELLGGTHQESSRHHNTPDPVSICLCCTCRKANLPVNIEFFSGKMAFLTKKQKPNMDSRKLEYFNNH
jgi:hypothetical protein